MAVNNITSNTLGKLVQIDFSDHVRNQITSYARDWENVLYLGPKNDDAGARSHDFMFQTSEGANSVQFAPADGSESEFPVHQEEDVGEYSAVYKEIDVSIALNYSLWKKAKATPKKYVDPLLLKIRSKGRAARREMSLALKGDGTGIRGIVSSATNATTPAGQLVITLATATASVGAAAHLQDGDLFYIMVNTATITAGTPSATIACSTSAGTAVYYKVKRRDLRNDKIYAEAYSSADALLTVDGVGSVVADNVLYKKGQKTAVATNAAISTDYNTLTEVWAGYESILADDGRVVHGITMDGGAMGTNYDAGGILFDPQHIQEGLTDVKTLVGEDVYEYNILELAPKVKDLFVQSIESDKYFSVGDDKVRGGSAFFYTHGNDKLRIDGSEFCPPNRIRAIPKARGDHAAGTEEGHGNPIEYRGTDFEMVDVDGSTFLAPGSTAGTHYRSIRKYMNARGLFIAKHPAACLTIKNYLF